LRNTLVLVAGACLVSLSMSPVSAQQQVNRAAVAPTSIDEVLQAVRSDLQGERADVMAKNLTLTAAQAAKFWPMFEAYQKEQNVIIDDQLKGIQHFIEDFEGLDDASALALITTHFDRDDKMTALRRKWLKDFQGVLGTKLAVRMMQIDRRLSLVQQLQIASKIPLTH